MNSYKKIQGRHFDLDAFDLAPIYEIGRSHSYDSNNPVDVFSVDKKGLESLQPLITGLIEFLTRSGSQRFEPFFIELSLYEPSDEEGKTFYSLMLSNHEDAFDLYEQQMDANIETRIKDDASDNKGIIIPNPHLYNSTYFLLPVNSQVMVLKDAFAEPRVRFGYFKDPGANRKYQGHENLKTSVGTFFTEVISSFEAIKTKGKNGLALNTAMLIPLYRPASSMDNKSFNMFKGGGIFLYGATYDDFNQHEFIIELKTLLLKSIFKQSFSQLEGEKITNRQIAVELNTFHHLRNNMSHLPEYLRKVRKSARKIPIESVESSILKVEGYITHLLNNTLSILKSYRSLVTQESSSQVFKVSELQKLFDRIKDPNWFYLSAENDARISDMVKIKPPRIKPESLSKILPVEPDGLFGIIANYIQNVIQAYLKEHTNLKNLEIVLSILEKELAECTVIEFSVFNSGTKIPKDKIESLGIVPNSSESSSGLGLYFINTMLNFVGAIRQSEQSRYFQLTNTKDGVNFSFEIKIEP